MFSLLGIVLGLFIPAGYVGLFGFLPIVMSFKYARDIYIDHKATQRSQAIIPLARENTMTCREDLELDLEANKQTTHQRSGLIPNNSSTSTESSAVIGSEGQQQYAIPESSPVSTATNPTTTESTMQTPDTNSQPTISTNTSIKGNPTDNNTSYLTNNDAESTDPPPPSVLADLFAASFGRCLHPQVLEVALLTIANGGDNISIYLPLFTTADSVTIVVTLITFYVFLSLWLFMTFTLLKAKRISVVLKKYGRYVVPPLLLGLGLYIISGTVIFPGST